MAKARISSKSSFYSIENSYGEFPKEGTFITCRGPLFVECYDRYSFELGGVEGPITVIVPKTTAAGKPWVFRSEFVSRDAMVDLGFAREGISCRHRPRSVQCGWSKLGSLERPSITI
jgi:hypothetical protein